MNVASHAYAPANRGRRELNASGGRGEPNASRALEASVREAIAAGAAALGAAGCDTPRLDAEVLLAHVLGTSRERLLVDPARALDRCAARAFDAALERRARAREPVAYITRRRHFRHLELAVDERALIPRHETELLVEIGLRLPRGAAVIDVGTGCGAVALALAHERPDLRVGASDVDPRALALAAENASALGLEVDLYRADLLAGVPDEFDALLANLPYVAERERELLAPEISHEPPLALFAGGDGLAAIRALIEQAASRPRLQQLALEVGASQGRAAAALMREHHFCDIALERDLAGIERVVRARRNSNG